MSFWGYAFSYIKTGSFSKENQLKLSKKFDTDRKDKLINMIKGMSSKNAIENVRNKFLDAIENYKKTAPNLAKKELNMFLIKIEEETNQDGFFKDILREI